MMQAREITGVAVAQKRAMPVKALLEWAFADECAQLDFEEEAGSAELRMAVDPIWRMMRQAELGCRVDGGRPAGLEPRRHSDAELIAAVVARLPLVHGGRGMAVRVAELSRARAEPDWMRGARPRVVPKAWRGNRHGSFAATESCGTARAVRKRGSVEVDVRCCPVVIRPTARQIAAARRGYLDWWGALLHLRHELALVGLGDHDVTDRMPPMTPWRSDQSDTEVIV